MIPTRRTAKSFACREVVAPAGFWERGAEASGYIPPSARLLPKSKTPPSQAVSGAPRAPKTNATPPSGGTRQGRSQSGSERPSLDIHASSVSPDAQRVAVETSTPHQIPGGQKCSVNPKSRRHALRRAAGKLMKRERVAGCGQKPMGGQVTIHRHAGQAHFGGVETCGSVWHCPVCAAKITEGRRTDLDALLAAHRDAGGTAFMATFTIPHHRFQSCESLRKGVSEAWRKVKNGKGWIRARERYRWLGDVRALEVTHGDNGWHPHLHVLILFQPKATKLDFEEFGAWLYDTWSRAIERSGFGVCSKGAFAWDKVNATEGAAEYVSKWGAALEMTKAHIKHGRNGGRTPFQILADYQARGYQRDARLFQEYAFAFKGARQLTWSRGLRDLYLNADVEASDEALATEPTMPETHTMTIDKALFREVARRGLTADLLLAVESGGFFSLIAFLKRCGIPWHGQTVPGLMQGKMVPLLSLGPPRELPYPQKSAVFETEGTPSTRRKVMKGN